MEYITSIQRISSLPTTTNRNGNGTFCSNFGGRISIEDKGSGFNIIIVC